MTLDQIAGVSHPPAGTPHGVVLLTHGAGGDRESPMLQRLCDEWANRGFLAIRYNLPFRRRRRKGPPSGSGAGDRDGITAAMDYARALADGPLIVGGHSYGGRQTSMVVAGADTPADLLALFSYPLHPPRNRRRSSSSLRSASSPAAKPEHPRTEHLSAIGVPTVFTQGSSDPFGSLAEIHAAAALVPAAHEVVEVTGARHDLASKTLDVPVLAVDAALRLLG